MAAPPYDVTPGRPGPYSPPPPRTLLLLGRVTGLLGLVVVGLGLLLVGLGWNGAAGIADVRQQTPYLLSGGFLGLSLVVLGGALMITANARADRARLEAKFDELLDAVRAGGGIGGGAGVGPAPDDLQGLVVAGSASYHVPGCRLVDGREDARYLLPTEARARGLSACRVCRPEDVAAPSPRR